MYVFVKVSNVFVEKIITHHLHLDTYPIPTISQRLIVGTIHPHPHIKPFEMPFFYGSNNTLWKILDEASGGEIGQPITLPNVLAFLEKHHIALSDTIRTCERKQPLTALDNDLIPLEYNTAMLQQIRDSEIHTIFFTSSTSKNAAFRLFYTQILGLKLTKNVLQTLRNEGKTLLNDTFFGREIRLVPLLAPSGAANIAVASSEVYKNQKHLFNHSKTPIHAFRVADYKKKMGWE